MGDIDVYDESTPTFADLDDDGDLDLVAGEEEGILNYYENTGTGSQPDFTERTGAANPLAGIDVGDSSTPTFADLDDDGDLDLVVGEWDGILNYYENTGSRSQPDFTERTGAVNPLAGIEVDYSSAPTFADLNGDGDLDLVVGEWYGALHYYENTGTRSQPNFTERTGAANPLDGIDVGSNSAPTFADLDNDGDLDLVVGEENGNLNYYENTGSRSQPSFTEPIGAANPLAGIDVGENDANPTFGDLDGDGDLDLVMGESDGILNYYENTGSRSQPNFTERIGAANPFAGIDVGDLSAPAFADRDGDGDLDLVVGEENGNLNYYENTGSRSQPDFTKRTGAANPFAGIDVGDDSTPTFVDRDGDGDLDLVVGEYGGYLYYYENIGISTNVGFNPSSLKENNGDAVAGVDTQYTMSVDEIFQGTLNPTSHEDGNWNDDTDWIRIELTAGTIYKFSIAGIAVAEDTWFFLSLLDSSGDNIFSTVYGFGSDAVIDVHRVSATGTYYLKVEGGDDNTDVWDYEVSVVENTTPEGTYDEIANYLTDGFWARRAFDVEPGGTLTADISALTPVGQQFARWGPGGLDLRYRYRLRIRGR